MAKADRYVQYRRIWNEHTGGLPKPCEECGVVIVRFGRNAGEGGIHHMNHNHDDHRIENLALLCVGCHFRHHRTGNSSWNKGKPWSATVRKKLSISHKGQIAWNKGRTVPADERHAIAAISQRRECECGLITNPGSLGRHISATGHKRREVA